MDILSKERVDYLSQSPSTRKILDFEAKQEARAREQERLAQLEKDFEKSQHIGKGKLRDEWKSYGRQHQRTGRLLLGDAPVVDGEHLLLWADGNESIEIVVRYIVKGELREIVGAVGDAETDEVFELKQGLRARRVEAPEEPGPVGWHLKYSSQSHKWRVIKGELFAGEFSDLQEAQELCAVLQSYDKRQPSTDIIFRQV